MSAFSKTPVPIQAMKAIGGIAIAHVRGMAGQIGFGVGTEVESSTGWQDEDLALTGRIRVRYKCTD